jgi:hypothetical protein
MHRNVYYPYFTAIINGKEKADTMLKYFSGRFVAAGLALFMTASVNGRAENTVMDHQIWDTLLQSHVVISNHGSASQVDYQGMMQDRKQLKHYLGQLQSVTPEAFSSWQKKQQLAFLINAYNAWTVELILSNYPVESIKEIGSWFQSPWKQRFIPLLGKIRTLDEIEHELIRGSPQYHEPRIHFAVNCASIGCPALRNEAYTGSKLEYQLTDATRLFLSDQTRNVFKDNTLYLSKIFKWYKEDFERGWRGYTALEQFLQHYLPQSGFNNSEIRQWRQNGSPIEYQDYHWGLNDIEH